MGARTFVWARGRRAGRALGHGQRQNAQVRETRIGVALFFLDEEVPKKTTTNDNMYVINVKPMRTNNPTKDNAAHANTIHSWVR